MDLSRKKLQILKITKTNFEDYYFLQQETVPYKKIGIEKPNTGNLSVDLMVLLINKLLQ